MYAGVQRGRAVGNGDFRAEFDPAADRWLVMARLRFIPYPSLDAAAASRRRREYRRRLRRFLYAGCEAVMVEGVVERKSWLHETLDDLMVLVWKGTDDAATRRVAERELDLLHADFNAYDEHLDDDGMVKVCHGLGGDRRRPRQLRPRRTPARCARYWHAYWIRRTNGRFARGIRLMRQAARRARRRRPNPLRTHYQPSVPNRRRSRMQQPRSPLKPSMVLFAGAALLLASALPSLAASVAAIVHKPSVDVHSGPDFSTPTIAKLSKDASVTISGQQGLWFQVATPGGKPGYVRVNDVRMAYAGKENGDANLKALFTGKAGKGHVTETAGVRGLDESDLKSAGFDAAQFAKLEGYRLSADAAAVQAHVHGLGDTAVAYAAEAKPAAASKGSATQAQKRGGLSLAARVVVASWRQHGRRR